MESMSVRSFVTSSASAQGRVFLVVKRVIPYLSGRDLWGGSNLRIMLKLSILIAS